MAVKVPSPAVSLVSLGALLLLTLWVTDFKWTSWPAPVDEGSQSLWSAVHTFPSTPSAHTLVSPPPLSPAVIGGVKKFVYFVGYQRSGHSIVGSLLDAHPHVVIAHEYFISKHFTELNRTSNNTWKENLFNILYRKSVRDAKRLRQNRKKGYTLGVDGQWQGRYDRYIEVIGDKSGGRATEDYRINKRAFVKNFLRMKEAVAIPVRIIHVVRNPFDMISTQLIIDTRGDEDLGILKARKQNGSLTPLDIPDGQKYITIESIFRKFDTALEMIDSFLGRENVLELHNDDLVKNPKSTISNIFTFLGVNTSEHYLDMCAGKVFKTVSQSRDLIMWSSQDIRTVENRISKYDMLDRYSFASD